MKTLEDNKVNASRSLLLQTRLNLLDPLLSTSGVTGVEVVSSLGCFQLEEESFD